MSLKTQDETTLELVITPTSSSILSNISQSNYEFMDEGQEENLLDEPMIRTISTPGDDEKYPKSPFYETNSFSRSLPNSSYFPRSNSSTPPRLTTASYLKDLLTTNLNNSINNSPSYSNAVSDSSTSSRSSSRSGSIGNMLDERYQVASNGRPSSLSINSNGSEIHNRARAASLSAQMVQQKRSNSLVVPKEKVPKNIRKRDSFFVSDSDIQFKEMLLQQQLALPTELSENLQ